MLLRVATNVVASRPPERQLTGILTIRANTKLPKIWEGGDQIVHNSNWKRFWDKGARIGGDAMFWKKIQIQFSQNLVQGRCPQRSWSGIFNIALLPIRWKFQPPKDPCQCFLCLFTLYLTWIENKTNIHQNISSRNSSSTSFGFGKLVQHMTPW